METILDVGGGRKWHWYSVYSDLIEQGNLTRKHLEIDPTKTTPHGQGGSYKGNLFYFTWVRDEFLLLTMKEFSQPLVDAFSAVLEYEPFAKYERDGMITVEWDKVAPEGRLVDLKGEKNLEQLR